MIRISILSSLFATVAAFSAAALPAEIDADGDGQASLSQLQLMYPDVTEDLFLEIDLDEDGYINDEEMIAAIGGERLANPEGDL